MNVPSGYTALDLVGFTDKGTYSSSSNYVRNDLVHYQGKIWKCKVDDTTNVTPTEGAKWTVWVNSADKITDLTDVNISSVSNNQVLGYNSTTSKWENKTLANVARTGAASDVTYNNTQSGLSATNVKGAIDEVSSDIQTLSNYVVEKGAKNLLKNIFSPINNLNGVKWTKNDDDSIVANGTASSNSVRYIAAWRDGELKAGKYKLTGLPSDGSSTSFAFWYGIKDSQSAYISSGYIFSASGAIIEVPQDYGEVRIEVEIKPGYTANNLLFKPMLTLAGVDDSDYAHYVPYTESNVELTKDTKGLTDNQFENGAVNLAEVDANGYALQGITFIVNADKTISTTGKSTNSTGNKYTSILACSNVANVQENKRYKLSGCPTGGGNALYDVLLFCRDSSNAVLLTIQDYGDGVEFTVPSGTVKTELYVRCYYNVTVTGKVFKPMITVADMPNSDYAHYVPYAKSNKTITDILTDLFKNVTIDDVTTSSSGNILLANYIPSGYHLVYAWVDSTAEQGVCTSSYNYYQHNPILHVLNGNGDVLANATVRIVLECAKINT